MLLFPHLTTPKNMDIYMVICIAFIINSLAKVASTLRDAISLANHCNISILYLGA